ncbi:MAG: hypothetical protein PHD74_08370, partial [Candidatus Krumholzibacteria bacterium]|nr:hypothetical protein [Candidatus Krumholzibacteria bacterium]
MMRSRTLFIISIIVMISTSVYAQDYVPNEVVVSFFEQSVDVFTTVGDTISCIYPEILSFLQEYDLKEAEECYHGTN